MVTKEELATKLNGREYLNELTREEEQEAKENGLVVVFGRSDDLCELRGTIHDEWGMGREKVDFVPLSHKGILMVDGAILSNECDNWACPYFERLKLSAPKIRMEWYDNGEYCWTYEAPFPVAEFDIMEDGEKYCRGIVFEMTELMIRERQQGDGR